MSALTRCSPARLAAQLKSDKLLLTTARCLLLTAYCLLLTAYWFLLTTYCVLLTAYYSLFAAYCLITYCSLPNAYSVVHIIRYCPVLPRVSPQVVFKNVGLFVIDEEQRFGVRQKEKIKEVAKAVDVLTLSATPIPRTMHMCLAGVDVQ